MNAGKREKGKGNSASGFDETLRLIATLPAPDGLADRVQAQLHAASLHAAGLRVAPAPASASARILRWPAAGRQAADWIADWIEEHSPASGWTQSAPARMAAAAAIVFVVLGGGWGVSSFVASRVQPMRPDSASAAPARMNAPAGFSSAGAMRTPQTLNRPIAAPPAAVQQQAAQAADRAANHVADQAPKQLTAKKSARHGKPAAARESIAQPAAPQQR